MADDLPIKVFASQETWERWLERNHAKAEGIWLKLAKKASRKRTVSYPEAVEVALCYGWIDGQTRGSTTTTSALHARARAEQLVEEQPGQGRGAHRAGQDAAAGAGRGRAGEGGRPLGRREPSSPRTLARRPEVGILGRCRTRHPSARRGQALRPDHGRRRPRPGRADGNLRRAPRSEWRREVDDDAAPDGPVDCGRGRDRGAWVRSKSKQARAQLGVAPQLDNLDTTLTVEQNLLVFSHLYRIDRCDRKEAIERALVMSKLVERRGDRVDKLSGGMRRRLLIARSLIHRPRLVLMDEPTVGLDPQVRQELWALIDLLRSDGTTILMSTHYIEEAQRLADTVMIMSHGTAVAPGTPSELVLEHAGREVLEVYGPPARLAEVEAEAGSAGLRTRRTGTSVSILDVDGFRGFDGVRRAANLEDVFVLLTGEEIA